MNTIIIHFVADIEAKSIFLVVVLLKVEQNSSRLEYDEIISGAILENGYAAIGVQLDEPWFLLGILANINLLNADDDNQCNESSTAIAILTRILTHRQP